MFRSMAGGASVSRFSGPLPFVADDDGGKSRQGEAGLLRREEEVFKGNRTLALFQKLGSNVPGVSPASLELLLPVFRVEMEEECIGRE